MKVLIYYLAHYHCSWYCPRPETGPLSVAHVDILLNCSSWPLIPSPSPSFLFRLKKAKEEWLTTLLRVTSHLARSETSRSSPAGS